MKITRRTEQEINISELKAAIKEGRGLEVIRPHDEITLALDTGETITPVCGYVGKHSARFVFKDCLREMWQMNKDMTNKGGYWSIGDRKAVTLNGTVGALTLSNVTTYAFIIGFNHNSSVEGTNRIHFQLGKTALSGGTDVALCDSHYNNTGGGFRMNTSNSNSGGWESSNMRTAICGTSLSSYSGTIIAVIPAALRAVLKSVTKYTNNTGDSSAASAVTATTDYFFLLSEYEVFGSTTYANSNEASKQAQYSYYSAGNSKVKYNHSATSTAVFWWLRSPFASGSAYFVFVLTVGTVSYYSAYYSYGFAPGFCV